MTRRDQDDDAPWLAEANPRMQTQVTKRSAFWTLAIILALAAIAVIGTVLLFVKKGGGATDGYMNAEQAPLIESLPGPYKEVPRDPQGMQIDGLDRTIDGASKGDGMTSAIDESSAPEDVMPRPGTAAGPPQDLMPAPQPVPLPAPAPVPALPAERAMVVQKPVPAVPRPADIAPKPVAKPAETKPAEPKPAEPKPILAKPILAKPATVQLGAFSTPELADAAWAKVAGKYGLAAKRVISVDSGGKTLYRLRGTAVDGCTRVKAGGDACAVVE